MKQDKSLTVEESTNRQKAFKILSVSVYGTVGSSTGVISALSCAEAVTSIGRAFQKMMGDAGRTLGAEAIYGDTDSVFVATRLEDEHQMMELYGDIKKELRRSTQCTGFKHLDVKLDGVAKSMFLDSKKKYTYVTPDGLMHSVGVSMVRKDVPPFVKVIGKLFHERLHLDLEPERLVFDLRTIIGFGVCNLDTCEMTLKEYATEQVSGGMAHYVFRDRRGTMRSVEVNNDSGKSYDIDKAWVIDFLEGALKGPLNVFADGASVRSMASVFRSRCEQLARGYGSV